MRRKPNIEARLERCADLLVVDPETLRGRWLSAFRYDELYVELGCGKGLFAFETAKSNPNVLIAALEKSASVMIAGPERAIAAGVSNIRFIHSLADNLMSYFAPGEVSRIYINFCDPWPGDRHAKRRLTHRRFLELYKLVLSPGGEVYFKTDNVPLFDFSLLEFEDNGFSISHLTRDLHKDGIVGLMTEYEQKFHALGTPICFARFSL